jgi:hypothetical protein
VQLNFPFRIGRQFVAAMFSQEMRARFHLGGCMQQLACVSGPRRRPGEIAKDVASFNKSRSCWAEYPMDSKRGAALTVPSAEPGWLTIG